MKNCMLIFYLTFILLGCTNKPLTLIEMINDEIGSNPSEAGAGSTFYVDPISGSVNNPGTKELPWRTFEEVLKNGLIETKNVDGLTINEGGLVHSGDTIILKTGYHGDIDIQYAYNEKAITVKADVDSRPVISSLSLDYGSSWVFDGLIVDGSLSSVLINPQNYLVSIGTSDSYGETFDIIFKNCYVFSDDNVDGWSADDWVNYTYNGIIMGRYARNVIVENNFVQNTGLALNISSKQSAIIGNRISYFAKDGIRVSSNNMVVSFNIITDNVAVDLNHDDGIQGYNGADGVHAVMMRGNVIIENYDSSNPHPGPLQGIGFFDGPLSGIVIVDNLVKIDAYHGISIYDSEQARIENNVVTGITDKKTKLYLGTKDKGGTSGNIVLSNFSRNFNLTIDESVIDNNNIVTDIDDYSEYSARLEQAVDIINRRYGKEHFASGQERLILEF